MQNKLEIFNKAQDLLDEPEVQELLNYCEQLEDELVNLKFEKNKELILLDMIKEVLKGCNAIEKEQLEHERFGYESPNYQATISNLKSYILEICRDNQIYL
jgi:HPt (histidine-containing phosphotransfer) domain-containing protein